MSADYSRIHRLLRILLLIQSEPGWNADRLANKCGTAVRTIYRDLDVLEQVGIPYYFDDATKGYRVRRDFFMPPVELTLDESLALIALVGQMAEQDQVPFMQPAAKAIAKGARRIARRPASGHGRSGPAHCRATGRAPARPRMSRMCMNWCVRRLPGGGRCGVLMNRWAREDDGRAAEVFHFHPYQLLFSQRLVCRGLSRGAS